ncbi:MAG: hypothetical protein Ct9H300mP11_20720 [Chloroflexota bacterium]|nr:MAG: hypothetical protein Ct9H300mP11_20720 [Chloroflexota bacterium]
METGPVQAGEIKAGLKTLGTALLWFTDFAHGLSPAVPAIIAMTVILLPGVGLVNWRDFETNMGWTNFFVIASSMSLANALIISGAAEWFADTWWEVSVVLEVIRADIVGDVRSRSGNPGNNA